MEIKLVLVLAVHVGIEIGLVVTSIKELKEYKDKKESFNNTIKTLVAGSVALVLSGTFTLDVAL